MKHEDGDPIMEIVSLQEEGERSELVLSLSFCLCHVKTQHGEGGRGDKPGRAPSEY